MSAFMRVHELKDGRNVFYTRIIPKTHFSFIIFGLQDGQVIIVVRKRNMVKNQIKSFEVIDILQSTCTLSVIYSMIQNNELEHLKEKTNEFI